MFFLKLNNQYIASVKGSGEIILTDEKPREGFSNAEEAEKYIKAFLQGVGGVRVVQ